MEVRITPDLEAKLARLATERGQDTQALVQEAIEKFSITTSGSAAK